jgi:hypothetical protein
MVIEDGGDDHFCFFIKEKRKKEIIL